MLAGREHQALAMLGNTIQGEIWTLIGTEFEFWAILTILLLKEVGSRLGWNFQKMLISAVGPRNGFVQIMFDQDPMPPSFLARIKSSFCIKSGREAFTVSPQRELVTV